MRVLRILAVSLLLADPVGAQVTPDSVRIEAVRSRAFLRAAETQLSKVLALLDSLLAQTGEVPAPEPLPLPSPLPEAPQGSAPLPGDHPDDRVVFDDLLSYPTSAEAHAAGWRAGPDDWGTSLFMDRSGPPGGRGSLRLEVPAGTGGPGLGHDLALPAGVREVLFDYWVRVDVPGPSAIDGKWHILHHDRERTSSGCRQASSSVNRYQLSVTGFRPNGLVTDGFTRFLGIGEATESCEGPVSSAPRFFPGFVWGENPAEAAPVLSGDPDIRLVPWTPMDVGWLRVTGRIVLGPDGFAQFWLGGFPAYDSQGGPMYFQAVPTRWVHETVSFLAHDGYTAWIGRPRMWVR